MVLAELLERLGYQGSPNFLTAGNGGFDSAIEYAHLFRHAAEPACSLRGVYTLGADQRAVIPVVYVCEAGSDEEARNVHRLVWNQNVVPLLIVNSPQTVRLYVGFNYPPRLPEKSDTFLAALSDFTNAAEVARFVEGIDTKGIDEGRVWSRWGREVRPEDRIDWHLLGNLRELDRRLQACDLDRPVSHALIGKYVYLHYLRDRGILSPRKLDAWHIPEKAVFGREATLDGLREVTERLDEWLNGSIFPIDFSAKGGPRDGHVRRVAATFAGDQPAGDDTWQLHLGFQAYDFSYITIETLSVVYEQFLHAPEEGHAVSRGRSVGAYYTPIPVVNFMISELEERRPLRRGMRVFDPSCGSGAFLVQCYRRLIEREFSPGKNGPLRAVELRKLLKEHIFGVDSDPDACSVAELSLILTLLDYVHPPDLEPDDRGRAPKLPKLRNENIFRDDFFREGTAWQHRIERGRCDWVVGNPPWKELKPKKLSKEDKRIWKWMRTNSKKHPVGGHQTARAFAWRASEFLSDNGEAAMFLPAMTLFDDPSRAFRKQFLRSMDVHCVGNFANLAEIISAGRFRVPAAALFWSFRPQGAEERDQGSFIRVYSPLVANQEPIRPQEEGTRCEACSIVVNASEVRDIPYEDVVDGNGLPWKLATWGSPLDERLLARLSRRFGSFEVAEKDGQLIASQGLELRTQDEGDEELEPVPEVVGKREVRMQELARLRRIFAFPEESLVRVESDRAYGRKGRIRLPLSVCRPPHVIVSAARNFAIYSEEFLVVPPPQIGIASPSCDGDFLRAVSLYLSSDFAFYHQFLTSSHFGVQRAFATLKALRAMPFPLNELPSGQLHEWTDLHAKLVSATRERFERRNNGAAPLYAPPPAANTDGFADRPVEPVGLPVTGPRAQRTRRSSRLGARPVSAE